MKRSKNTKKLKKDLIKVEHFLYFVLAGFLIVFVWWLIEVNNVKYNRETGNFYSAPIEKQDYYKSLDISLARQADYSSEAVKQERNLGITHQVKHIVFSFGVPQDNLIEKGLMTLPQTSPPKGGYPVLILLHGYVNPLYYSTESAYLGDMEFYSQHGFAVLKPDLRGQGLSLADGSAEGAYYSMAYNTDTMSLIAAAKKTSYLNADKINLWGHSMGAYIALRTAVISKDVKNAILLSGPVGYISDMFTSYVAISDTSNSSAATIRLDAFDRYGTPLTNPTYWAKVSPLSYLNNTTAYIQIHVGTADTVVPPLLSADLDQALTKADKPHQYYVYNGGGHGLVGQRGQIWQRSLDLMTK